MNNKSRKRIWPVSMAAVIGAVAMLAVLAMVALPAGTAQAQPADPAAPEAVGGLSASPMATSVTLSWTAAQKGAFDISGHEVEYKTSSASSWMSSADDLAMNATSHQVTGLTASTAYDFRVRAVAGSTGQFEGPWATVSATTTASGGTSGGGQTSSPTEDCEIKLNAAGAITKPSGATGSCAAQGDTAEVMVMGSDAATEDATLSLLIVDAGGPITAYPNGTMWSSDKLADANGAAAKSMRYRFQSMTVPKAKANATTGIIEGQKVTLMVKGDVYLWAGSVSVTSPIPDIPSGNAASGSREVADNAKMLDITFLGVPAIGEDGTDDNETFDAHEVRSKLDVDSGTTTYASADASVEDGKSKDITLTGNQSAVTIRATIVDAKNNLLNDIEVTFAATSVPAGIENRTRQYDTKNGMADHTISGLPTDKAYRVTVVVTAGEDNPLTVGTVVIARAGDLDTVMAEACVMLAAGKKDGNTDDGCMKGYDPKMVYGQGDSFSIYANASDNQGSMVNPDTFMVKPATMEGYGDATKAFNIPTAGKNLPSAGLTVMVQEDAPHGKYLLDVIATKGTGNKKITKTDQVMVTVSGPLAMYVIEGSERIQPGQVVTYTVHAQDELGNPADYAEGQDTMADVFVDANPATIPVRLLDLSNSMINLSGDSKATFRLRVPPGSGHGTLTITVADKNTDVPDAFLDVSIGSNRAPMAGAAIADQTVTEGMTVSVQSTITDSDAGDTLTWSASSSDDMIATATVNNMGMVTIMGVAAGMATITVTATDMAGEMATQDIMVTTQAPPELMAPSNVRANPVGSGLVNVGWDMVAGAAGYTIVAVNIADTSDVVTESVNNPDATAGQIGNLTVGAEYNIYVGSFDANLDFEIDFAEKVRVTIE